MKKRIYSLLLCAVLLISAISAGTVPVRAASNGKISSNGIEMIKAFEGFSQYPYWDHSQYTVGYGTKCPDEDYERYQKDGITEAEAEALLREHLTDVEQAVNWFANQNGLTLTQARFDALADFTYNCGSKWMTGTSKFRAAVLNGTTGQEFVQVIASWCTASGTVYSGLINRRLCEANLYLNGIYGTTADSFYSYVLYNAHGGTLSATGYQVFPAGTTADFRLTATRSGYDFQGWYTKSSGGTRISALDSSLNASTLHAYWQAQNGTSNGTNSPDYKITEVNYPRTVSVTNYLNIRAEPNSSSDAIGKLKNGAVVQIVAETTIDGVTWGKLSDGGWICLKYTTDYLDDPDGGDDSETKTSVTTTTVLNIRSGAGTNYPQTGTLSAGKTVTITKTKTVSNTPWGKLSDGGWICLTYTTYGKTNDSGSDDSTMSVKVTNGPINIRSGAGTSYAIQGTLETGKTVTITKTKTVSNTPWGKLSSGGWICLTYTNYHTDSSNSDGSSGTNITVRVTNGPLNVRSGAGTSYAIQKSLAAGTTVTIVATKTVSGTTWGKLSGGGWISLAYTDYAADSTGGTASGTTGSSGSTTGTVNSAGGLNVRASASTAAAVVGTYVNGTKVTILEQKTVDGVSWGRTVDGWISMQYVKTGSGNSTASSTKTYTVTGDLVNVRSGAGTTYGIVKQMTKGTSVTIASTKTDSTGMTWGQISGVGWIAMQYLA